MPVLRKVVIDIKRFARLRTSANNSLDNRHDNRNHNHESSESKKGWEKQS